MRSIMKKTDSIQSIYAYIYISSRTFLTKSIFFPVQPGQHPFKLMTNLKILSAFYLCGIAELQIIMLKRLVENSSRFNMNNIVWL